jgi:hypothetical protein
VPHRPIVAFGLTTWLLVPGLFHPYELPAQEGSEGTPVSEIQVLRFPIEPSPLALTGPVRSGEYMGAVGSRAAWLGFETGQGEVWVHPLKVAREIGLSFKIPEYSRPIPGRDVARWVEARPEAFTITYSHGAFQVKQHLLAPRDLPGILLLLEVDAVVDLEIHVEFQPVMQYAWPGGMGGQYLYWDAENRAFVLSESLGRRNAIIGSPWATEASAHPAHRLAEAPSTFVVPVDPVRAAREFIPIAIAGGASTREEVLTTYRTLLSEAAGIYGANRRWARALQEETLSVSGAPFSPSLEWAKVNLEDQRSCNPDLGCGLVAGWGPSGTSLRAGFGWYFGGDAAINSLALDATGQWDLAAEGLRFLARYQREDGKIPHEISQAAGTIPWFEEFPYAYYHADTTPFWILALGMYWRASGDDALVRELWPTVERAYQWCVSVETDGDGIIENTTGGLGAIEVGGLGEGMHQDIYLAAVWMQALLGMRQMAAAMGEDELASEADSVFRRASRTLNQAYWRPEEGHLAFGILMDGGTNDNLTAWPGTALSFSLVDEDRAEATLQHLASDVISASWGARLLSTKSDLYDPLHYNNGAVWPFMTGFVSWGQYRYRRPWAGFPLLRALHGLTFDFGLGRHPENLSGAYYQTMDATVPHQFFATSMLVTSLARGLLGWEPNAPAREATLAPQPPPSWGSLAVENLRVGASTLTMLQTWGSESARVALTVQGPPVELTFVQSIPLGAEDIRMEGNVERGRAHQEGGFHDQTYRLTFTLAEENPADLAFSWRGGLAPEPPQLPLTPGAKSGGLRILDFRMEEDDWILLLEGDGGDVHELTLFGQSVRTTEGQMPSKAGNDGSMVFPVEFPSGAGRVKKTVRFQRVG